jgi:hypothetical protein
MSDWRARTVRHAYPGYIHNPYQSPMTVQGRTTSGPDHLRNQGRFVRQDSHQPQPIRREEVPVRPYTLMAILQSASA